MNRFVLASSLLIAALGRMMMTDPLLNLCLAAAMFTYWESIEGDRRWRWVAGFVLPAATAAL